MRSPAIEAGLNRYGIGPKLRALRLKKKLGLTQLGEHTGLSPALLSKIERGRLFPTLPTLLRISMVFGVGLDYFFLDTREKPVVAVVRRADRIRLPERPGDTRPAYFFESLDFPATERRLAGYYVEFEPVEARDARPHQHPGAEIVYVIQGSASITVDAETYVLEAGDSMYFDASRPHSYRRSGEAPCSAIVVTA